LVGDPAAPYDFCEPVGDSVRWAGARATATVDLHEDKAWLLQSRINPVPVPGAVALTGGRISFSIDSEADAEALDWLEKELDAEDLKGRLATGEPVVVFDHPLSDCVVTWPITGGGAVMIVRPPGHKWVVSYDHPSPGAITTPMGFLSGRRRAKAWKKALADSGV
jgi:hypothetical protein